MFETDFIQQFTLVAAELLPRTLAQVQNYKIRRFDCIVGFIMEPYWIYYGYTTKQWGIALLGIVFLAFFAYGIYHKWFIPFRKKQQATI